MPEGHTIEDEPIVADPEDTDPRLEMAERKRDEALARLKERAGRPSATSRVFSEAADEELQKAIPEAIHALRRAASDGDAGAASRLLEIAERRSML